MNARNRSTHVLVVEDDAPIRQLLVTTLQAEGFVVFEAATARDGETLAGNRRIDLFLVDLGLPDRDGVELIRRLREWTQRPIIVLSARAQEQQKVDALDAGADDYLTKPFGVAELHARLRVSLRHVARSAGAGEATVRLGEVTIDLSARTVRRGDEAVHLTATQWRLLQVLGQHVGKVVTSRQLLREVWGPAHSDQGHYLRIYIRQLRQKLESEPAHPAYLLTDAGVGYRLLADTADSLHNVA